MDKRRHTRTKRRLNCELRVGDERHPGIVKDVSESGLFAQTGAKLSLNQVVEVLFPASAWGSAFSLRARVARIRKVPSQLMRVVPGGIGLEVLETPAEFRNLVSGERKPGQDQESGRRMAEVQVKARLSGFRVRVHQVGGNRSRILTVEAENEQQAVALALRQVGARWEVRSVEPI